MGSSKLKNKNRIIILDQSLINKIAAGEIIERPANVVKELIENSMDAGANSISIDIKIGGIELIKVTDDGVGIDQRDVQIAVMRHSTSKLDKLDNLYSVSTLGFRGEALAAISEVSDLELVTRQSDSNSVFGTYLHVKGGKVINQNEIGCANGTTIKVKDLFFNTAVRLKYLKSDRIEAGFVADIVQKNALLHPSIKFKYFSDGKLKFNTSGNSDLITVIHSLYGKEYAENSIIIDYSENLIKVTGVIGTPQLTRSNRDMQLISINGRCIKSPLISTAVTDAYKTRILSREHPFFILNIEMPFNWVDVNVHPSKMEVKFDCERELYRIVYWAVLSTLENFLANKNTHTGFIKNNLGNVILHPNLDKNISRIMDLPINLNSKEDDNFKTINITSNNVISNKFEEIGFQELECNYNSQLSGNSIKNDKEPAQIIDRNLDVQGLASSIENNYKFMGQFFECYLVFEKPDQEILIIDQHAAHERLIYEKLIYESLNNKKIVTTQLINPEMIVLTYPEFTIIEKNIELLGKMGFVIENFGDNSVIVREVPLELVNHSVEQIILELVQTLKNVNPVDENDMSKLTSAQEKIVAHIACRLAVKANRILDESEAYELLEEILKIPNIESCPHGRPFMINIPKNELDRKFKRR